MTTIIPWAAFLLLVFCLLALDLGVLNRKEHVIGTAEALKWTLFWISLALLFSVGIYFIYDNNWMGLGACAAGDDTCVPIRGTDAVLLYLQGWLTEKALSLDNIAVMAMIFASFRVPLAYQHRVLFWGILGALVMRGIMIGVGAAAISQFHWILYIFGVLLIYFAWKTAFGSEDDETDPQDKWITKFLKKHFRYTGEINGLHFFEKRDGLSYFTPLMLCLIVIEISDVIFAVDSIPAIFAITQEPFIVFTSNIFAILGLRSLYFILSSIIEKFRFLKTAVGFILFFVAVKLLMPAGISIYNSATGSGIVSPEIPEIASLAVILGSIVVGILASIIYNRLHPEKSDDDGQKMLDANES